MRVTFNRKSRRIPTTLYVSDVDINKRKWEIKGEKLKKAMALASEMEDAAGAISPFDLELMDIDDVVDRIRRERTRSASFSLLFIEYGLSLAETKKEGTAHCYRSHLNSFRRYLRTIGLEDIDINDISPALVSAFVEFYEEEPRIHPVQGSLIASRSTKRRGASASALSVLQSIYNKALRTFNDDRDDIRAIKPSPFKNIQKVRPDVREAGTKAVSRQVIQDIISFDGKCTRTRRFVLDLFVISFGLMGVNIVDLYSMERPGPDGILHFFRQKTRDRIGPMAEGRVRIEPELMPFVTRAAATSGPYWLKFHELGLDMNQTQALVVNIFYHMDDIFGCGKLTFGSARSTWATLAYKAGVSRDMIDECLLHAPAQKMTVPYVETDWELRWKANRKVLDLFEWPGTKRAPAISPGIWFEYSPGTGVPDGEYLCEFPEGKRISSVEGGEWTDGMPLRYMKIPE